MEICNRSQGEEKRLMEKRITLLIGSARKNGNTEILADAFCKGIQEAGNTVHKITLFNRNIKGCLDCKYCYKHEGTCVLKDDMPEVYAALKETDLLVIASPVYFYNFSAQLKAVFDRMHNPIREEFPIKEVVLLSVCADQGMEVFHPLIETYKAINQYLGWEDKGSICVDGVEDKGKIIGHEKLKLAEELGRRVAK